MEAAVYEVFIVCEWVVMSFSLVLQFFVTACGPEINPKGNIFSGKEESFVGPLQYLGFQI